MKHTVRSISDTLLKKQLVLSVNANTIMTTSHSSLKL